VVAGKIVTGELVALACERHLRDLKDIHKRGYYWIAADPRREVAEIFDDRMGFFPSMFSITHGVKEGQPFNLLPWHEFAVGSLLGWVNADGRLRFRRGWLEAGKGQAKSPILAGLGLYYMGWHGVKRAEVYAIAQDRDQANVVFKDAAAMCRAQVPCADRGETLESLGEVVLRGNLDNVWKIERPSMGSKFQALANDEAVSGPRPIAILGDEVHEYKSDSMIEKWMRAIAKAPGDAQMILGTNSPATTQPIASAYADYMEDIIRGRNNDDSEFAFIARVDKADVENIFENEAVWPKALPALGLTFSVDNLRGEVHKAKRLYSTAASVKRLYFGIRVGAAEFWISEEAWVAVQERVDPAEMLGMDCYLSLDLSDKNDLTALTATWKAKSGHLYSKTWYWTRRVGLEVRAIEDRAPYEAWESAGWLNVVDGPVIDKIFVAQQVKKLLDDGHNVQFLAVDIAGIDDFLDACAYETVNFKCYRWRGEKEPMKEGLPFVSHAQGKRVAFEDRQLCMPRSIERTEDIILNKGISIDASPVTYFCASNVKIDMDAQANKCFDKQRSRGRIDGMVTIAMGVGAATTPLKIRRRERGLITVIG
jgi:phage terminase large subunit-like protein